VSKPWQAAADWVFLQEVTEEAEGWWERQNSQLATSGPGGVAFKLAELIMGLVNKQGREFRRSINGPVLNNLSWAAVRALFISILGMALLLGCTAQKERAVTHLQSHLATNGSVAVAAPQPPIAHGDIIARIIGPHLPTPSTAISSAPNTIPNFWVTLEVTGIRDGFASELKGKTIRLPTCEFDAALVGQTLPLRISCSPGRSQGSDYWLTCTSIDMSRWVAAASGTK
jgi:hypothetical protein